MKPRSVDEWRVVLDLIDAFLKRLREADSAGRLHMLEEGQQLLPADPLGDSRSLRDSLGLDLRPADAAQGWQPIERTVPVPRSLVERAMESCQVNNDHEAWNALIRILDPAAFPSKENP